MSRTSASARYTLSCTDGDFTGCLLLLVSKSMRASSRSIRFHTIAVYGTPKQYQLAGLATHYQPVVRHLFFAAVEGGEEREDWRGDLHIRSQWDLDDSDNAAPRAHQVEKESRQ